MIEKSYPYQPAWKLVISGIIFLVAGAFLFFLVKLLGVPPIEWVLAHLRVLDLAIYIPPFACLLGAVYCFLVAVLGFNIKRIVLSKEGVILKRRYRPIVIQKITDVKDLNGRLNLTGTTPEAKSVNKTISRGDIGKKRWDEFKEDLQKIAGVSLKGKDG